MRGLLYTFTHAAIKYLTAFRLNGGGREERGRRARATSASEARRVEDAPVHHLGPTLFGPVWHLAVGRSVGRSAAATAATHGERGRRGQERREGRKAKVRAGRRKRPRQDVGSCLPAGG